MTSEYENRQAIDALKAEEGFPDVHALHSARSGCKADSYVVYAFQGDRELRVCDFWFSGPTRAVARFAAEKMARDINAGNYSYNNAAQLNIN